MTRYTTKAQARADAARLMQLPRTGRLPLLLVAHLEAVLLNPRSGSDTLLITADALRDAAADLARQPEGRDLAALANIFTDLAPTRANLIEAA